MALHDRLFQNGDHVEFDNLQDSSITETGVVLDYLEADDQGFKGGYHVASYYVLPEESLRPAVDHVLVKEAVSE